MNLQDTYNAQVGAQSLGVLGAATAQLISAGEGTESAARFLGEKIVETTGKLVKSATGDIDMPQGDASDVRFLTRNLLTSISEGIGTGIDIGNGNALNPYIALSFDGMDLKTHNLSWRLSPRSEAESDKIRDIIYSLRRAMHPKYKALGESIGNEIVNNTVLSRAFLEYPSVVDMFFLGVEPSYFYYFKRCMISNMSINYSPEGLMFLKGGKPGAVTINLTLNEMEIHTKDDYPATSFTD